MIPVQNYPDRRAAGRMLAAHVLDRFEREEDIIVLALPRGGVPVGLEVARALDAPLDVFVVRKLGVPGRDEFAFGAIAAGGFEHLDHALIAHLGLSPFEIAAVADRETVELQRREQAYRSSRPALPLHGRDVLVVDDGLATGWSMRAALDAVRACEPHRLVAAVPVGAPDTCAEIARLADRFVCPLQPESFTCVGEWYGDFATVSDEEVRGLLATAALERSHHDRAPAAPHQH
jgi:predicted phosphoribosyltransferase